MCCDHGTVSALSRFLKGVLVALLFGLSTNSQTKAEGEDTNYRLSPNDLIEFRVFQEGDMDSVVRVSGDGTATFPLIGGVTIGGKTIAQAVELLRARYLDGYLASPQITITIRDYARRRFTVLGQVQKPGSYELSGNEGIGLLQAIGMAGGYTRIADPGNITVKRREEGQEKILRFNAKKMANSDSDTTFLVKSGDTITVGESIF